ncbi:MAG TPA: aminomethyl-transferring glycine dehydrogenase subunit GcvPA [Candidatus Thermoplasmatota archaeon]|nr:aminomethyl-transferring glycine dehydrogenase subunit GcvPA [Candidatus Thermoplasmatota archaeon]
MHFMSGAADRDAMFAALGITSYEDLFKDVPASVRTTLRLAAGASELDVRREMTATLAKNHSFEKRPHFLGAGSYHHYVPAMVKPLILRGEFYTSYTPYQPEILQGMLQAMFEYQTFVTRLMELEVANISMYDGPTALAEGALMGVRASRGNDVLVPANLSWEKKSIVANYVKGFGGKLVEFGYDRETGEADLADLESKVGASTAAVLLQNPNFFGVFESRAGEIRGILDRKAPKAFFVVDVGDPYSLGLVRGPGSYGADVAVGEGGAVGSGTWFGGPALGLFATKWDHVRRMPGRIVGETVDAKGERAYCLTLSTREQHIRRDKATSNICSNEALNALAFSITLAALGEEGFRDAALACADRARRLANEAVKVHGVTRAFTGKSFHEFVLKTEVPTSKVAASFAKQGLVGGLDLAKWHPELGNAALYCVTEAHPESALSGFAAAIQEAIK